jgi:uncharacterized delta-60 repeat protein
LGIAVMTAILFSALFSVPSAWASFGIAAFTATATNRAGSVDLQAGSHPYEFTVELALNEDGEGSLEGTLRSVAIDLPAGLIAYSGATPRCSRADFVTGEVPSCPGATQVGVADINRGLSPAFHAGVYNLTPNPGSPATLGLSIDNSTVLLDASPRGGSDYGITASDPIVPTRVTIRSITEHLWGVPADPGHDPERICFPDGPEGGMVEGCSSDADPAPFLSLPTACAGPLQTTLRVDSVESPGAFQSKTVESLDSGGLPTGLDGCNALRFEPRISSQPSTNLTDSPTGLAFDVHQPQDDRPEGLATAQLKNIQIALPPGMTLNPAAAAGLGACSEAQIGYEPGEGAIRFSSAPQSCPDAAKVGNARIATPLLDEPLQGAVYLAKQGDNPFRSLLALYVVAEDPLRGVTIKLAGSVAPDPRSGQLTVTFEELPQLPFEDLALDFFAGPEAIFTTPLTCGPHRTTSVLTPWTTPAGADAQPSDSFGVASAPGGGACAASEAQAPNSPAFDAGTLTPTAGAHSPFVLRLTRASGSQQMRALSVTLPPGLSAAIAGVPECSEARIAVAPARGAAGAGVLEEAAPSCPKGSEVGSVNVAAGSGTPLYVHGHAYMAGPYKGAPLSLAIVIPAVAGPFDLGTVLVRVALRVDPKTAAITAEADPLPTMAHGIPLDIRSIAVDVDRLGFIRNPTSCDPMAVRGEAVSVAGQAAGLVNRFQVGGCQRLAFKPKLSLRLLGPTHRGAHPGLRTILTSRAGEANLRSARVAIPGTELLDSRHIRAVCRRAQLAARACPAASSVGRVKAWTPLLDRPLEGSVFLRSSAGRLPGLAAVLHGQVDVELTGSISSERGRLSVGFGSLPDVPIEKLALTISGGRKGLLVNTGGVCAHGTRVAVRLRSQSGSSQELAPRVRKQCGALLAAAAQPLPVSRAGAEAGTHLDRSFGRAGHVLVPGLAAGPVALDRQGRLLAASGDRDSLLLTRYRSDGTPDPGFGEDGTAEVSLADQVRAPEAAEEIQGTGIFAADVLAVDPEGQVLIGSDYLWRLLPGGTVDEDFGRHPRNPDAPSRVQSGMSIHSILIRGEGFLLGGETAKAVVSRYGPHGLLDRGFGNGRRGGRIALPPPPKGKSRYYVQASFADLENGPHGTIYASGEDNGALLLARIRRDGRLDHSFAGHGLVEVNPSSRRGCACFTGGELARDRRGRLLVAGSLEALSGVSLHKQSVVARFLPDGTLDRSFGDEGFVRTLANSETSVGGIVVDRRGRIVIAGRSARAARSHSGGPGSFTVIRYLPDGRLDTSFFGDGIFKSRFGGVEAEATEPLIDATGRLVVAGSVSRGVRFDHLNTQGLVVRFAS